MIYSAFELSVGDAQSSAPLISLTVHSLSSNEERIVGIPWCEGAEIILYHHEFIKHNFNLTHRCHKANKRSRTNITSED